jgi:hypothetical protein
MENEMVDACYDTPDERDWKYKDVFEEEMV